MEKVKCPFQQKKYDFNLSDIIIEDNKNEIINNNIADLIKASKNSSNNSLNCKIDIQNHILLKNRKSKHSAINKISNNEIKAENKQINSNYVFKINSYLNDDENEDFNKEESSIEETKTKEFSFNSKLVDKKSNNFNNKREVLHTQNNQLAKKNYFIKRKFEKSENNIFLTLGVTSDNLELLENNDSVLEPKILFKYPNKSNDEDIFNINFLKSFCFHDGVNCKLIDIANEDEFESKFLFQNYFSNAIDYFILTQNSQQQEVYVDEVFYIFGMKYYDFHIINTYDYIKKKNSLKLFQYEKLNLFISKTPALYLFKLMMKTILNLKRLSLVMNLSEFCCIFIEKNLTCFKNMTNENENNNIRRLIENLNSLLQYNEKNLTDKEINYSFNTLNFNYTFPSFLNMKFLPMEYLSSYLFEILEIEYLYDIIVRLLLDHSFLIISESLELATSLVLALYFIILPFKWPFTLIPHIPNSMISFVESPVPYIIGIKGSLDDFNYFKDDNSFENNIIHISQKMKATIYFHTESSFKEPSFNNLKSKIYKRHSEIDLSKNDSSVYFNLYIEIYDSLRNCLASILEKAINLFNNKTTNNINLTNVNYKLNSLQYTNIKNSFLGMIDISDYEFCRIFTNSQIFINYIDYYKENVLNKS